MCGPVPISILSIAVAISALAVQSFSSTVQNAVTLSSTAAVDSPVIAPAVLSQVDGAKKRAVLAKVGKEAGFNLYTMNFLNLLVSKDRMPLLEEICESFEELYCKVTDTQVGRPSNAMVAFRDT